MIRLSACVEGIFSEIADFPEQIPAAARAGLDGIEFYSSSRDLDAVAAVCREVKLPVSAMLIPPSAGMLDAQLADRFVEATQKTIAAAQVVGCRNLVCVTGWDPSNAPRSLQHAGVVACLQAAAPLAEAAGITLVLEALNTLVDHPGYFLDHSREGFGIVDEVGSSAVKLLYDIYHMQVMEGNLIATITSHIEQIGHFHIADVPGRHEPGTGEINWENVLAAIDGTDYHGFVTLEYGPSAGVSAMESLQHIVKLRDQING
jgi:hydroxypyruvate isomerase